ncbi:peptidase domain-containing ABC transporter [Mesorhizobium atlanticum]
MADAGKARLAFGQLANWPQTLVTPIERVMVLGTMLIGAYLAMNDQTGYMVGSLFAFMMIAQRVAQPLVGLARLVEDYEEVGAAIGEAASVLNRPLESASNSAGLRPKLAGNISFDDLTFSYMGTKTPALDHVTFDVPAGTMFGIVGRSGSGKSTIARLLQGINRDYSGFLKLDGVDLKEINLRHLRQGLGVVLQDNFLFRGSIRDNIIAGRPGLTLSDAMRAAHLAGAAEFIERMPNGYDTYIEEGSPNLSGGQRQRLAIARALIHNPSILILDEATSALDPESEAVVSANLMRIASGRTMVIVSHRLASLTECDQILVMDQGKVLDVAPHFGAARTMRSLPSAVVPAEQAPRYATWPSGRCAAGRGLEAGSAMSSITVSAPPARRRGVEASDPTAPVILEFQWPSTAVANAPFHASRAASFGSSSLWSSRC